MPITRGYAGGKTQSRSADSVTLSSFDELCEEAPMSDVAAPLSASEQRTMLDAARVWWLFLITGTAWLLFSIIVFRFDYTTVSAIAIVFGILMLGFALMEVVSLMTTHGWRRLLHAV